MLKTSRILLVAIVKQLLFWNVGFLTEIALLECLPPDYPLFGGYGPRNPTYLPGDRIHYFCDTDTYIGGNFLRICLDSGDWTGDTPVCDTPDFFSSMTQSSTAEPESENDASRASDGERETCSKTSLVSQEQPTWTGLFETPRDTLRVMLFLPKGPVAYEVWIIRKDGSQQSCGGSQKNIVMYEWVFHNCPEPNNTGIVGVKIESLDGRPLELCEVVTHSLTDPTCVDPHFVIDNGRLAITRKKAELICNPGYTKGRSKEIECVRTGVWSRKQLYCEETKWELEKVTGTREEVTRERERISNKDKTARHV